MAVCQATCRQMIGCFATAPSGHATLPPFTHCLFVVTGDNSNPMTNVECDHQYTADDITEAKRDLYTDPADPDKDPVDCVPGQTGAGVYHTEQRSLKDFMQESNTSRACNQTDINPSPVVETAYVTLTPNVVTDYVTLTPEMQTVHVTMTMSPDVQTAYVTVTPAIQTAYVTLTQEMPTAYVTVTQSGYDVVTTTVDRAVPTTVAQTVTVTESSSQACSYSDNSVAPATVPQTDTVVQTQNVTQTQTQTVTQTQVVTQTQIISASTVCEPQPSSYPCSNTTNNTETGTYEEQRTEEQIRLDLEALLKDLAINRNNVSRSRRKKESALDERKSAQTIGAAAVAFLVVAALFIAGMDISTLFRKIFSLRSAVAAKSCS
ncbi:poly(A) polymerase-like [Littorina saxatilis]